jgi:hypothetical protein
VLEIEDRRRLHGWTTCLASVFAVNAEMGWRINLMYLDGFSLREEEEGVGLPNGNEK